jgi:phenylalanyl-tRNA synthetase beta chain
MKILREWVSDYVDPGRRSDREIADTLTGIGHAVESIEDAGGSTVFEIEFTTNRIDAMSHYGVARELAAAWRLPLTPPPAFESATAEGEVGISIEAPQMCTRYTALVIRGVEVRPSSADVQRRLEAAGLRPINNVVDATNYVMLATGHPLHAFDLAKIRGNRIVVRAGRPGEKIFSLDAVERQIDEETVVIADGERPVALGGVIGGANSEISERTRELLIECAHFDPSTIRRTARRLGISTDAGYRFERGVDPDDTLTAVRMVAEMIVKEAGGTYGTPVDVVAAAPAKKKLVLRERSLATMSAGEIPLDWAAELLGALSMNPRRAEDSVEVEVPTWRVDIEQEADLLEEVLRFWGYDRIPPSLPRLTTGDVRSEPIADAAEEVRNLLEGCGLTEAITYSFIRAEENGRFSSEEALTISNALTANLASMRLTLFPGLLQAAAFNRNHGSRDGALFEVGRTYHRDGGGVCERHVAALVLFGATGSGWNDPKRPYDFFDAKGMVESVAAHFHVPLEWESADVEAMQRGQASIATSGGRRIATAGALTREVLQQFDVKGDVIGAEIDLEALLASVSEWRMSPVSRYPGVPMVLSLLHEPSLPYGEIVEKIRQLNVPYLEDVGLWDRFVPDSVDADEVKTTLAMWYQAFDRSLTQDEVSELHRALGAKVGELLPVRIAASS